MSNEETARELEKLRADVAALSDARRETASRPAEPLQTEAAPVEEEHLLDDLIPPEQKSQLEELGELLQEEIRDLPTITCLAVFSLGILMGRLMR